MLYFRCPTCKTILADKQLIIEEQMKQICDNQNISDQKKEELKTKIFEKININRETNYCCSMRILTFIDLTDAIQ